MRIAFLLLPVVAAGLSPNPQDHPSRPNFVIMMCDDQRWDAMGAYGNKVLQTPNMDRIAKKLIHYYQEPEEFELYDLEKDPDERDNLYGKPERDDLSKKLLGRIDELRTELGDK